MLESELKMEELSSEIMDTIVVGSESCEIIDLVDVLEKCPNNSLLYENFTKLARKLKVKETDIKELQSNKLLGRITRNDQFVQLFEIWATDQEDKATLGKLATALGDCNLNNIKVWLKKSELVKRATQKPLEVQQPQKQQDVKEGVRPLTDEEKNEN